MNASVLDEKEEQKGGNSLLLQTVLRFALSGVFILSGIYKLEDPATFEVTLIHWRLFPDDLIGTLVWGVPLMEIVTAWASLSNQWGRLGLKALLFLTSIYTLLLVVQWMRGIPPDCGCFGAMSAGWPYLALVFRNVGLIGVEVFLIAFGSLRLLLSFIWELFPWEAKRKRQFC
jgi:hypothetical protein